MSQLFHFQNEPSYYQFGRQSLGLGMMQTQEGHGSSIHHGSRATTLEVSVKHAIGSANKRLLTFSMTNTTVPIRKNRTKLPRYRNTKLPDPMIRSIPRRTTMTCLYRCTNRPKWTFGLWTLLRWRYNSRTRFGRLIIFVYIVRTYTPYVVGWHATRTSHSARGR